MVFFEKKNKTHHYTDNDVLDVSDGNSTVWNKYLKENWDIQGKIGTRCDSP